MKKSIFRNSPTLLLLAFIALVGLTTALICLSAFKGSAATQHDFVGDSEVVHFPGLSFRSLASHEFQKYIETFVAKKLRLRHFFIRINNQLYFSLFKKSFAENGGVIVGKQGELYQAHYITAYCHSPELSDQALDAWVANLKQVNNYFKASGITFIYLITPSKAEYKPEGIPDRFHCQRRGLHPNLQRLEARLRAAGISYVNGPQRMATADRYSDLSLFPRGGTHWNWLGAALGAEAVLKVVDHERHSHLAPLSIQYEISALKKEDSDADLVDLMNVIHPDQHYSVPQVQLVTPAHSQLAATIIGGSFDDNLVKILLKNKIFSQLHYYFYFRSERTFIAGQKDPVDHKMDPLSPEVLKTLLSSQVVILEENSSLLAQSEQGKQLIKMLSL